MEFKDRIKQLREGKGLNLTQLAVQFDLKESGVRAWEMGRTKPGADTLIRLAKFFDCTTDYLLGLADAKEVENLAVVADLGITEEAIINIRKCVDESTDISRFLASSYFVRLVRILSAYWRVDDDAFWKSPPKWLTTQFPAGTNEEIKRSFIESRLNTVMGLIRGGKRGSRKAIQAERDDF